MSKKEVINLNISSHSIIENGFEFTVRVNDLFSIILTVVTRKDKFNASELIEILNNLFFSSGDPFKIISCNSKFFNFKLNDIADINFKIFSDYFKLSSLKEIKQYIRNNYILNENFKIFIKNLYTLSVLKMSDSNKLVLSK